MTVVLAGNPSAKFDVPYLTSHLYVHRARERDSNLLLTDFVTVCQPCGTVHDIWLIVAFHYSYEGLNYPHTVFTSIVNNLGKNMTLALPDYHVLMRN